MSDEYEQRTFLPDDDSTLSTGQHRPAPRDAGDSGRPVHRVTIDERYPEDPHWSREWKPSRAERRQMRRGGAMRAVDWMPLAICVFVFVVCVLAGAL